MRCVIAALLILLCAGAPARGQEGDSCKEPYDRAMTLYRGQQFAEAAAAFHVAYEACRDARLLVNLGRSQFKLGQVREALFQYRRYLALEPHPDVESRALVQRYIDEAQALLDKAHLLLQEAPPRTAPQLPIVPQRAALPPPPPPPGKRPLYRRAWFWGVVGGVAAGAAAGVALAVTRPWEDVRGVTVYPVGGP